MIKLSEGELLDLLPSQLKNDTDMICLSYALKRAVDRLLVYERQTMTDNFIDSLPESILDVLAVELRSPYYIDSMNIETKRSIIKNTLIWHTKAGTPSAVSEMITTIFGEGYLVEWFEFTEGEQTPGYFDIVTNARMTEDIVESFMNIIKRVKNERSHIRRILINRKVEHPEWVGWGAVSSPKRPVTNAPKIHSDIQGEEGVATQTISTPKEHILNGYPNRESEADGQEHAGATAMSAPKEIIGNSATPATRSVQRSDKALVAAVYNPRIRVENGGVVEESAPEQKQKVAVGAVSSPKIII